MHARKHVRKHTYAHAYGTQIHCRRICAHTNTQTYILLAKINPEQ